MISIKCRSFSLTIPRKGMEAFSYAPVLALKEYRQLGVIQYLLQNALALFVDLLRVAFGGWEDAAGAAAMFVQGASGLPKGGPGERIENGREGEASVFHKEGLAGLLNSGEQNGQGDIVYSLKMDAHVIIAIVV